MRLITSKRDFETLATEFGVRGDWHEPDEQSVTARVEGVSFDNAGFWPTDNATRYGMAPDSIELHVVFSRWTSHSEACESGDIDCACPSEDIAAVNLATLCAWATGRQE